MFFRRHVTFYAMAVVFLPFNLPIVNGTTLYDLICSAFKVEELQTELSDRLHLLERKIERKFLLFYFAI